MLFLLDPQVTPTTSFTSIFYTHYNSRTEITSRQLQKLSQPLLPLSNRQHESRVVRGDQNTKTLPLANSRDQSAAFIFETDPTAIYQLHLATRERIRMLDM